MAPRIIITEDKIKKTAFQIVRENGLEGLSARKLANRLECSTQPVYRAFRNMKELESVVLKEVDDYVDSFIWNSSESGHSLAKVLLGFYQFALKEQELFRLKVKQAEVETDFINNKYPFKLNKLLQYLEKEKDLSGLSAKQKTDILINVWIYMIGLFNVVGIKSTDNSKKFIADRLEDIVESCVQNELNKQMQAIA